MTHNLKLLGLAVAVVFAMAAAMASTTQAQIKITVGSSPAWLTGEQTLHSEGNSTHSFTLTGGQVLTCGTVKFTATVKNGDTAITMVPAYSNCNVKIGSEKLNATVTMNDCDYLFHGGREFSTTKFWEGEVDLVCPEGKRVEIHVYKSFSEIEELCTYTVSPFTNKVGNEFRNEALTPDDVTITTTVGLITTVRDGSLLCGGAISSATYTGSTTVRAFADEGGFISSGTVFGVFEGAQTSLTASG